MIYEIKVAPSLKAGYAAGRGSSTHGGAPATVGHRYGFGSTEEPLRRLIYGHKARGNKRDGPLNHATGLGWVASVKGQYADALQKGTIVNAMIVEATGGVTPATLAVVRRLTRRSQGKGAVDRTQYGTTRVSTKSFYTHHTQQMSKAAVMYDAKAIRKQVGLTGFKQHAFGVCGGHGGGSGR